MYRGPPSPTLFPPTPLFLSLKPARAPRGAPVPRAGATAAGLLLESVTCAPPAGAGPFSVTVPAEGLPPVTLAGLSASEETIGGITVSEAVCVRPEEGRVGKEGRSRGSPHG